MYNYCITVAMRSIRIHHNCYYDIMSSRVWRATTRDAIISLLLWSSSSLLFDAGDQDTGARELILFFTADPREYDAYLPTRGSSFYGRNEYVMSSSSIHREKRKRIINCSLNFHKKSTDVIQYNI